MSSIEESNCMDLAAIPKLAAGCRLHPTQPVLLIPEGTLQLTGPSREILHLVDGKQSVAAIIEILLQKYDGAPRNEIEADVVALLDRLQERGVVRA